jgi:hypothetical protein
MYDRDAALRHQIAHVAITQLVSDILSYGLNDKKMVELTAFEERGLSQERWVMPTIIHKYQICARTYKSRLKPRKNTPSIARAWMEYSFSVLIKRLVFDSPAF